MNNIDQGIQQETAIYVSSSEWSTFMIELQFVTERAKRSRVIKGACSSIYDLHTKINNAFQRYM